MFWKKRLRLQFSLGFLLIAIVPFAWFALQYALAQKRAVISQQLSDMGLYVFYLDTFADDEYYDACTRLLFFTDQPNRAVEVIRPGLWGFFLGYGNQRELVVFTDAWFGNIDSPAGLRFDEYVPLLIKLPGLKRIVLCGTTIPDMRVDESFFVLSPDQADESQEFRRRIQSVRPDIEICRIAIGNRRRFPNTRQLAPIYGPGPEASDDHGTTNAIGDESKTAEPKTNDQNDNMVLDPFGISLEPPTTAPGEKRE